MSFTYKVTKEIEIDDSDIQALIFNLVNLLERNKNDLCTAKNEIECGQCPHSNCPDSRIKAILNRNGLL